MTNKLLANLVRRIRRTFTKEELQKIWLDGSDEDMFIRIGMTAEREDMDFIGRITADERREFKWLGYEIVTNSPMAPARHLTMEY